MSGPAGITIRRVSALGDAEVDALAEVLIDCVEGGAGVSFLRPLEREKARRFWRGVGAQVAAAERALLIAEDALGIVGTVQLQLAQPENQPHRADLAKMLVHRRARRRGVGTALLQAAELTARDCGKTLLVLDTNEGSEAERLYAHQGWVRVGTIPDYSIDAGGGLRPATFYYRNL